MREYRSRKQLVFAKSNGRQTYTKIGIGTIAFQKWDVSFFVLSTERPCDWDDFAAVGVNAAPHPVVLIGRKVHIVLQYLFSNFFLKFVFKPRGSKR